MKNIKLIPFLLPCNSLGFEAQLFSSHNTKYIMRSLLICIEWCTWRYWHRLQYSILYAYILSLRRTLVPVLSDSLASSGSSAFSGSFTSSGSLICKPRLGVHQLRLGDNLNVLFSSPNIPPYLECNKVRYGNQAVYPTPRRVYVHICYFFFYKGLKETE